MKRTYLVFLLVGLFFASQSAPAQEDDLWSSINKIANGHTANPSIFGKPPEWKIMSTGEQGWWYQADNGKIPPMAVAPPTGKYILIPFVSREDEADKRDPELMGERGLHGRQVAYGWPGVTLEPSGHGKFGISGERGVLLVPIKQNTLVVSSYRPTVEPRPRFAPADIYVGGIASAISMGENRDLVGFGGSLRFQGKSSFAELLVGGADVSENASDMIFAAKVAPLKWGPLALYGAVSYGYSFDPVDNLNWEQQFALGGGLDISFNVTEDLLFSVSGGVSYNAFRMGNEVQRDLAVHGNAGLFFRIH